MANKSLSTRISRNRSALVTQLHKLIVRYSPLVPMRERAYLNKVAQTGESLYWLEENKNVLVAAALIEKDHNIKMENGVELTNVGCFVSTKPGTMERILDHIWKDLIGQNLYVLCRPVIAESLNLICNKRKMAGFNSAELYTVLPDLANQKTGYFNMGKQNFHQAMAMHNNTMFIQLNNDSLDLLEKSNPEFVKLYNEKLNEIE